MACKHDYRKARDNECGDYVCTKCGMEAWDAKWVAVLIFAPFILLGITMLVSLFK
jgi:hypothetical protein